MLILTVGRLRAGRRRSLSGITNQAADELQWRHKRISGAKQAAEKRDRESGLGKGIGLSRAVKAIPFGSGFSLCGKPLFHVAAAPGAKGARIEKNA